MKKKISNQIQLKQAWKRKITGWWGSRVLTHLWQGRDNLGGFTRTSESDKIQCVIIGSFYRMWSVGTLLKRPFDFYLARDKWKSKPTSFLGCISVPMIKRWYHDKSKQKIKTNYGHSPCLTQGIDNESSIPQTHRAMLDRCIQLNLRFKAGVNGVPFSFCLAFNVACLSQNWM